MPFTSVGSEPHTESTRASLWMGRLPRTLNFGSLTYAEPASYRSSECARRTLGARATCRE